MKQENKKIIIYTIVIIILIIVIITILFLKYKNNKIIEEELYGTWNRNSLAEVYTPDNQRHNFIYDGYQYISIDSKEFQKCVKKNETDNYNCDHYNYSIKKNKLIIKSNDKDIVYEYNIDDNILILKNVNNEETVVYTYTKNNS